MTCVSECADVTLAPEVAEPGQERAYGERFEGPAGCIRRVQPAGPGSEYDQTLSSFTVASMSISSSEKINVVP